MGVFKLIIEQLSIFDLESFLYETLEPPRLLIVCYLLTSRDGLSNPSRRFK